MPRLKLSFTHLRFKRQICSDLTAHFTLPKFVVARRNVLDLVDNAIVPPNVDHISSSVIGKLDMQSLDLALSQLGNFESLSVLTLEEDISLFSVVADKLLFFNVDCQHRAEADL